MDKVLPGNSRSRLSDYLRVLWREQAVLCGHEPDTTADHYSQNEQSSVLCSEIRFQKDNHIKVIKQCLLS